MLQVLATSAPAGEADGKLPAARKSGGLCIAGPSADADGAVASGGLLAEARSRPWRLPPSPTIPRVKLLLVLFRPVLREVKGLLEGFRF